MIQSHSMALPAIWPQQQSESRQLLHIQDRILYSPSISAFGSRRKCRSQKPYKVSSLRRTSSHYPALLRHILCGQVISNLTASVQLLYREIRLRRIMSRWLPVSRCLDRECGSIPRSMASYVIRTVNRCLMPSPYMYTCPLICSSL